MIITMRVPAPSGGFFEPDAFDAAVGGPVTKTGAIAVTGSGEPAMLDGATLVSAAVTDDGRAAILELDLDAAGEEFFTYFGDDMDLPP